MQTSNTLFPSDKLLPLNYNMATAPVAPGGSKPFYPDDKGEPVCFCNGAADHVQLTCVHA